MKHTNNLANKLINEKSPYLQQHAYNPVNWFPWGQEAFEKAQKEDKPIFLSIGYSTCHWCHVMERESFENEKIAQLLNDTFISIKVDREERPDIDHIYMAVCQMISGHGGWPLSIFLFPDKKPFFAGTYFPPESKYGRIGIRDLITRIDDAWKNHREALLQSSSDIIQTLNAYSNRTQTESLNNNILDSAYQKFLNQYDSINGGFGSHPKFPSPQNFLFLLRYYNTTQNKQALEIVENTLQKMALGGIYDQLGFGFHRYSTDDNWLLPHFEKMLYDQAMLCIAYSETYTITKNPFYKKIGEEVISFVLKDLKSPGYGFYSAFDADSEGEEGKYYVWSDSELKEILTTEEFNTIKTLYNIQEDGNFLDESTREKTYKNILHLTKRLSNEDDKKISRLREKLLKTRAQRIPPMRDEKILTDWNALMIVALIKSGIAFENESYLTIAKETLNFILDHFIADQGILLHSQTNTESKIYGNLDDYAFLTWAMLDLYEYTLDFNYLKRSIELIEHTISSFWDKKSGGFYFTPNYGEELIVRKKEIFDGAIPSGNSVMLLNLFKLYKITFNERYKSYGEKLILFFGEEINSSPHAFTFLLCAIDFISSPNQKEIFLLGNKSSDTFKSFIQKIHQDFTPNKSIAYIDDAFKALTVIDKSLFNYKTINPDFTAYICTNNVCSEAITK